MVPLDEPFEREARVVVELMVLLLEDVVVLVRNEKPKPTGSAGEIADDETLAAYAETLRDLEVELAEARGDHDADLIARLEHERTAILAEVKAAKGARGRRRRAADDVEKPELDPHGRHAGDSRHPRP